MSPPVMDQIGRIHLAWKRQVARNLAPHGVNPKQIYLLRQLRARRVLTPAQVAELLFADRPTATSMLGTLERAGWITRRRDPDNGRQVLVELTAEGRAKLDSVPERLWRSGRVRGEPDAALTADERAALARLLAKLEAALGD